MALLKKLIEDEALRQFWGEIQQRCFDVDAVEQRLTQSKMPLKEFACGHEFFGLHKLENGNFVFREWAPNATQMFLVGDFSKWQEISEFECKKIGESWELEIPKGKICHGQNYHLKIYWNGGSGTRIPSYARYVVQDDETKLFSAQIIDEKPYVWKNALPKKAIEYPLIYEAHIGMAQEDGKVGTYDEFRLNILPKIIKAGYNTLQLMAIMEHPYYGSFGYHVSSLFAASSRFGTPKQLKRLIDEAHAAGLYVIIDLVHSHAVKNEVEGLACFDGSETQYFHFGERGNHHAWDSKCFNYQKTSVIHFLLSNCRFWLDEYKLDGFRFDGVTSMLYFHHGLNYDFINYQSYFNGCIDKDAEIYLALANKVIHQVTPHAITIAEDVSGLPGLGAKVEEGGIGFDYRLAMNIPDFWFKRFHEDDYDWNMDYLFFELTNRRIDEQSISYVESHDQAIVGDKTMAFELMDSAMYQSMDNASESLTVERGMALHKMARLITLITASGGYLNFMGNEFGHPEWIDFPREGNGWSYKYARRQWSLVDNAFLRYRFLAAFDKKMLDSVRDNNLLNNTCYKCHSHCDNHVLGIVRGDYFFLFNFHPTNSYVDYSVNVPFTDYELSFTTDDKEFGGNGFVTNGKYHAKDGKIQVYLPSRTALVLKKIR